MPTLEAASDPALANKIINSVLADPVEDEVVEEHEPEIAPASDTVFDLLGGHVLPTGEVVTEVEVRELTGRDEEVIAKATSLSKVIRTALIRGTVRVGEQKATEALVDSLLAGDCDWILLHIYAATFGAEVSVTPYCPSCETRVETTINILDVPVTRLESAYDRNFTVDCKVGRVDVTLPTGKTQRAMMAAVDKSVAEISTMMLADCVTRVKDVPLYNTGQVLDMSITDRRKISEAIISRNPGPRLADITTACPECGTEMEVPLSTAALFQFQ